MNRLRFALLTVCMSWFGFVPSAMAGIVTVCADGCTASTIAGAVTAASSGDTISVLSTYARAGETFPVNISKENLTIECQSGAVLGQSSPTGNNTFQLNTSSTVSGCTFSNINLYTASDVYRSGITIQNNIVADATTGTMQFVSSLGYSTISGNRNLDTISLQGTSTNVTISNNVFYGDHTLNNPPSGLLLYVEATSSAMIVTGNYFESRFTTSADSNLKLVSIATNGVTFTTNTVRYIETPPSGVLTSFALLFDGGTHTISGNKIETPPRSLGDTSQCDALSMHPNSNMVQTTTLIVRNNTLRNRCDAGHTFVLSDAGRDAGITMYVSSTRNILYAERSSSRGAMEFSHGIANSIVGTLDENAVYGSFLANRTNQSSANVEAGTNYFTMNPLFQLYDVATANDLDVAPFSIYLDIDGAGTRIGASTTTRRTTVYLDDSGTIDYTTVDATSTASVTTSLRSGDALSLAAGVYAGFEINSAYATTSLTISGVGGSTVINAGSNANALALTGVTSTSISGLVLQNASSTANAYTSTRMNFIYGGNSYVDAIGDLGISANTTNYILDSDLNALAVEADGTSINSATAIGTDAYHIVLISYAGARATLLVPTSVFANQSAFETATGGFGITTDVFIQNAFTVSDSVYTYNSATVAAANVTLVGGLTTPAITTASATRYAGLKLTSSGGVTISNVTSTVNGYGVWFASGGGNRIYDSVLSANDGYDIRQGASVTNTVDNVTFTRASTLVDSGAAPVLVKVRARAQARRAANTATVLEGSAITATDGLSTATALGSTGADGYTDYARLPAYTITDAVNSTSNGGYNTYTFAAGSISGYSSSSTTATLATRDQTVTIDLVSNVAATAPSSAAIGSITATGATLTWNDNSDDETSFTIHYVTSSLGESFPGTTTSASAGATSLALTVFYPNLQYQVRVAAVGPGGTSSYSTSSVFRTLAATPGAPTLTATGRTTATVLIDTNENSTSTEFLLYNSTLGSYVTGTGVTASTPYWATTSTWAAVTISDLTCNTSYSFVSVARNADATETSTSTAGTVTTSACATVSSGGGGGGVGASGSAFIPLPISALIPVTTVPTAPLPPIIVADTVPAPSASLPLPTTSAPLPPAAPATVRLLQSDARAFGVTVTPADQERLASFVDNGTTPETRALGSGERRALVRDALQTMGRSNLPLADLERMARGEIPTTRNLVRERAQLTRVRATFRSIYNRDPNFKNADENLVWNTLMYRIRFPRDLAAEREGIQDFRRTFNRAPSDPFQWAVVRALGYVL